ncbi:SDR family oxidoreductase [Thermopolyspora sp. NPDC052614]|uniref:SDR family oxidoreductase n=1 Tax=Thermopolyspora sp. NPDC052614 TaxID=3155682 RepID=UPI0034431A94
MRVLITGGASGLGAAVAEAVAKDGGRPLVIDRSPVGQVADQMAGQVVGQVMVEQVQADLADRLAAERAVDDLARAAGGLDAVVTAAGIDACGRLEDVPAAEWERVIRVNLFGTASVVRAALPYLRESRGRVVTVASTLGLRAVSDATAYCASKFGVVGFTRALAAETAGSVGVTLVVPGGMDTPFFDNREERYKPPPDLRLNDPREVAEAVMFALSRPAGCELRELVICSDQETSWP